MDDGPAMLTVNVAEGIRARWTTGQPRLRVRSPEVICAPVDSQSSCFVENDRSDQHIYGGAWFGRVSRTTGGCWGRAARMISG
jgi:hypothetical protein